MELVVLVDNNTLIDRYFLGEPGFSVLIRDEESNVLFDTGYSDIFIRNALKMGYDLTDLDCIAFSHGHLDHTWGLEPLIRYYSELHGEKRLFKRPVLIAHPQTFVGVCHDDFGEFGSLITESRLKKHFFLNLCDRPQALSTRLTYLGEIPRRNDFEALLTFGRKDGADSGDKVPEDSALVYRTDDGLVIITGCAHAGICNTVEYAKEVCGDDRIVDIIGGFHLQNPPEKQLKGTVAYLEKIKPLTLHACHCTDLASKIAMAKAVNIKEVGVGMVLRYS